LLSAFLATFGRGQRGTFSILSFRAGEQMVGESQRHRLALAISLAALALHAVSLRRARVVREIVHEPVVEVPAPLIEVAAPVVEVPSPVVEVAAVHGAPESSLRRIAALLALLGVILYVYLTVVYDRFYSVLHVEPSDVGLSYATTLSRSSGLIATVVAIVAGTWFLLRWIRVSLLGIGIAVDFPSGAAVAALALMAGVVLLWAFAPLLAYPITEPTREASVAAKAVLAGKPVAPVRLGPITLMDLRAEAATVIPKGKPEDFPAVHDLGKRTNLLYLGQADGTVVLFDPTARQALRLPTDAALLRLSRPAPVQARSLLCPLTPPPRWWHGPSWLRARLPRAHGC
jgi:hypothetical protein